MLPWAVPYIFSSQSDYKMPLEILGHKKRLNLAIRTSGPISPFLCLPDTSKTSSYSTAVAIVGEGKRRKGETKVLFGNIARQLHIFCTYQVFALISTYFWGTFESSLGILKHCDPLLPLLRLRQCISNLAGHLIPSAAARAPSVTKGLFCLLGCHHFSN